MAFDQPLIEHAVGDNNGFAHHQEKLNYAFALPNPADFPKLVTLAEDDKGVLRTAHTAHVENWRVAFKR